MLSLRRLVAYSVAILAVAVGVIVANVWAAAREQGGARR